MTVDRDTFSTMTGAEATKVIEGLSSADEVIALVQEEKGNKARVSVLKAAEDKLKELKKEQKTAEPKAGEQSATPGAAKPLKAQPNEDDQAMSPSDIKADQKTAAEHVPAEDGIRPEVVSSTNQPPEEALREHFDSIAEQAKVKPEEAEEITVRTDVLQTALSGQLIGHFNLDAAKATIENVLEQEKVIEKGIKEAKKIKPADMQEAAELHHTYPDVFPDPLGAAVVESSNVDTHAQRDAVMEANAAPLRTIVAEKVLAATENGSQHNISSIKAEEGEIWPPQPDPEMTLVEERDKETEKAKKEQRAAAKKAFGTIKDEDAIVPHLREAAPSTGTQPTDAAWDDESYEHLKVLSSPSNGLAVGSLVSRHDEAHEYMGVVLSIDSTNPNHALAEVQFQSEDKPVWLAPNNLKYEGMLDLATA